MKLKRITACLLSVLLVFAMLQSVAFADAQNETSIGAFDGMELEHQTVYFADGSRLDIILTVYAAESETGNASALATVKTKTGSKSYQYSYADGTLGWKATHTATFTYNGTSATCTAASCSVTIYKNGWYVSSKNTTRSGATSNTALTMGYRESGVTIQTRSCTISLSCDKNGNLS